ncbi:MAG: PilZ domain-containing protein [Myxococcaceae bacterium]
MAEAEKKVTLELTHARDVLKHTYPNGRLGGLRFVGPAPAPLGERVQMLVKVQEPARRSFKVLGQLAWATHQQKGRGESFGVDFIVEDEPGRERLLAFASEKLSADATRYSDRVTTDLPVKITHDGMTRKESLFDLSEGGAFVRTRLPIPVGSKVTFELRPPMSLRSIALDARVAWVRRTGEAPGYGLEFVKGTAREQERIRKLLDKLSRGA